MNSNHLALKNKHDLSLRYDFPRPDFLRENTLLLDGEWSLVPDRWGLGIQKEWFKYTEAEKLLNSETCAKVRVPHPLESRFNQVNLSPLGLTPEKLKDYKYIWYIKKFSGEELTHKQALLNFNGVDYKAKVWLNGVYLGEHAGGYTQFTFPVQFVDKENMLVVAVTDSNAPWQMRGRQRWGNVSGKDYHQSVSGIWQSVWLEGVSSIYINNIEWQYHEKDIVFHVNVKGFSERHIPGCSLTVKFFAAQIYGAKAGKELVREVKLATMIDAFHNGEFTFSIPQKTLAEWDIVKPNLHPVEFVIHHGERVYDKVYTYFGKRQLLCDKSEFKINKRNVYPMMLIYDGLFQEGIYTPENKSIYREDLEKIKAYGFNGVRAYQKVEFPQFYFQADMTGLMVWQDIPSSYRANSNNNDSTLKVAGEFFQTKQFHPSIIITSLHNETHGIWPILINKKYSQQLYNTVDLCRKKWPNYLFVDNCGFHHVNTDLVDLQQYVPSSDESRHFYKLIAEGLRVAPVWSNYIPRLLGMPSVQSPYVHGYEERQKPLFISEFGSFGYKNRYKDMAYKDFLDMELRDILEVKAIRGFCYCRYADSPWYQDGLFDTARNSKIENLDSIIKKALRQYKHI